MFGLTSWRKEQADLDRKAQDAAQALADKYQMDVEVRTDNGHVWKASPK